LIFLVFSDIHGNFNAARKIIDIAVKIDADFIVGCGDFEDTAILQLIHSYHRHFFSVPGNVDGPSVLRNMEKLNICLHGELIKINSLFLGGIGGYKMKQFLPKLINKLTCFKPEKWVLISHFPPKNTAADRFFIGFHIGSRKIKELIERLKPIACFCGHVDESPCITFYQNTLIVNPGPAFRWRVAIVDLKNMTANLIKLK